MIKNQFPCRRCPSCDDASSPNRLICTAPRAESSEFESLVPIWNGFFKEKVFFSYSRCRKCGLLFAPTFFDQSHLEALYAQMPPNMDSVPTSALRQTQRGYFEHLKQLSPLTGDFLELGPDVGMFIENCVTEGRFDRYWLFEPNRAVVDDLERVVRGRQHTIVHEMSSFSIIPDRSLSCVVMIHVLDHLLDPLRTLRELRAKVVPGALLVIVTHDESSLLARVLGPRWPAFCLQHPQLFNKKSMANLLSVAGYRVVKQAKTTNYFPISFLVRHLLYTMGIRKPVSVPFGQMSLGLKLGNILTIAAPDAVQ